ncbi:hypothetical protein, partial [Burkholderia latens]|uniref:hypothetical protein n=1 Tax=Burkholderia latens TaxID=488446 RepID=UPI00158C444D
MVAPLDRQTPNCINKYHQHGALPAATQKPATLDGDAISAILGLTESAPGPRAGGVPRGVADNQPQLAVPTRALSAQDNTVLVMVPKLLSVLSEKRTPKALAANAQRWSDAVRKAGSQLGAAHQVAAQGEGLHGAAAVTLMMAELGNVKADNAQNAIAQNDRIGASRAKATQAAEEKVVKEFEAALNDLKGKPEKAEMLKALEAYMSGADSYTLSDGVKLDFSDGMVQCYYQGTHEERAADLAKFKDIVSDFLAASGKSGDIDFDGSIVWLDSPSDMASQLGDTVSNAVNQLENDIQADTQKIDSGLSQDPALYGQIDRVAYKSILVGEDDVLKQLDQVEQAEKSASGADKAALQKQEAALKAQLTTDLQINAHLDPQQVLDFGSLSEMGMVQNILKRVKEMAAKGELDGIDKSVIDAATQALQTQSNMLEAMSHLHGDAFITLCRASMDEAQESIDIVGRDINQKINAERAEAKKEAEAAAEKKFNEVLADLKKKQAELNGDEATAADVAQIAQHISDVLNAVQSARDSFWGGGENFFSGGAIDAEIANKAQTLAGLNGDLASLKGKMDDLKQGIDQDLQEMSALVKADPALTGEFQDELQAFGQQLMANLKSERQELDIYRVFDGLFSGIGMSDSGLSARMAELKDSITEALHELNELGQFDPSVYTQMDSATYQAVLETDDDDLKHLHADEQMEKALQKQLDDPNTPAFLKSVDKFLLAALKSEDVQLKAEITDCMKIMTKVDPAILDTNNMVLMRLVQDVLNRTRKMAADGELNGIDPKLIDAAIKALEAQTDMLLALGHLHGVAEVTMIFGALGTVMEKNNETELNNSEHVSES